MTEIEKKPFKSNLEKIYNNPSENIKELIQEYINSPKDLQDEIQHINMLIESNNDPKKLIFFIEVLHKSIKKHKDYKLFYKYIIKSLEVFDHIKHSVLVLRIIKTVIDSRFYAPLSFYLIKLLKRLTSEKNLITIGKNIDYDSLKLSDDESRSEELVFFGVYEIKILLLKHLSVFSNNVGFPEIACLVINELRKIEYGKFIDGIIKVIDKQRRYVLDERKKSAINMLDMDTIVKFEKSVERMKFE